MVLARGCGCWSFWLLVQRERSQVSLVLIYLIELIEGSISGAKSSIWSRFRFDSFNLRHQKFNRILFIIIILRCHIRNFFELILFGGITSLSWRSFRWLIQFIDKRLKTALSWVHIILPPFHCVDIKAWFNATGELSIVIVLVRKLGYFLKFIWNILSEFIFGEEL